MDTTLFKVVTELPNEGVENKVYLVATAKSDDTNHYAEYIYLEKKWEKIGEFQSEVELKTSATKIDEDIPVAGGPLADLCNKAGITSIKADTNLQDLLISLFAKEMWPSPTFTEGSIKSAIGAPAYSLSVDDGSLVEVGTTVTANACRITAPTVLGGAVNREIKGLTYGYSSLNDNTVEEKKTAVSVTASNIMPDSAGVYGLQRIINGKSENVVSGAAYTSVTYPSTTFNAVEGANSVDVQCTGPGLKATFAAIPALYACSNFGKTSEDHKTTAKEALNVTATPVQVVSFASAPAQPTNRKKITFTGVYPFFATTAQIDTLAKQALQTSKEYNVILVAESDAEKQKFAIPADKSVAGIQMLNTLSGKYETYDISKFTKTTKDMTVGGKSVTYAVYTRNDGKNGSATFKITLK